MLTKYTEAAESQQNQCHQRECNVDHHSKNQHMIKNIHRIDWVSLRNLNPGLKEQTLSHYQRSAESCFLDLELLLVYHQMTTAELSLSTYYF
jgi:hypothetical protein